MLDNLWFWISDKLNEYEKEACNLLAMNVELFTSIGKDLHGHNFQSSWRIVTQIGNLLLIDRNVRMRDWNWLNQRKTDMTLEGGSIVVEVAPLLVS